MEDQVLSLIQRSGLTRIADDITSLLRYTIRIDVGMLYFYIPQSALITRDFAQAHLLMQGN